MKTAKAYAKKKGMVDDEEDEEGSPLQKRVIKNMKAGLMDMLPNGEAKFEVVRDDSAVDMGGSSMPKRYKKRREKK